VTAPVVHELPVALVVKVLTRDGVRAIRVRCPHCSRLHLHGWPPGELEPGVRLAHCHRPRGEPARTYRIDSAGGVR
jgi:hypothetical protein